MAVLWPKSTPFLQGNEGAPPAVGLATGAEREVVFDGGSDPAIRLEGDRYVATGSVNAGSWSARADLGSSDVAASVADGRWSLRWIPADERILGIALRCGNGSLRGNASFRREGGEVDARGRLAMDIGPAGFAGEVSRRLGDGAFELVRGAESPVLLAWSGSEWTAQQELSVRIPFAGTIRTRLSNGEGHPLPLDARYRLETRSVSSGWGIEWSAGRTGPWFAFGDDHGELRLSGWSDTLGSDRRFHDLRVLSGTTREAVGWRFGRWALEGRREERSIDAPNASFFAPFLAWNVFDPSSWAPVDQILSDRREHVSGSLDYRCWAGSVSWGRGGKVFDARLSAGASWRALDVHLLHRSTRLDFLGTGWELKTDSVSAPRLRAILLDLAGGVVLHLGTFGDLETGGAMAVPLRIERLRRDGTIGDASTGGGDGELGEDDGLWALRAGWRGVW